jgi:branched-chain amino acid aminotransferase
MAFSLNSYPVTYRSWYQIQSKTWTEEWLEKPHKTPAEEAAMGEGERDTLIASRNFYDDMPLVNYTTQYGLGCFEGLKALPQKDGGLAIFRPDRNAERFRRSMEGLLMPGFPEDRLVAACLEVVRRNAKLGFRPVYKGEWEKDSFSTADSIYIRPFTYSEGGIGVAPSRAPAVMIITTPVSAYFAGGKSAATTTDRVRATPRGTGWIKTASNYVISTLAKHEANAAGFMECVFLDSREGKYLEEGSSSNIFVRFKSGELATPALGDTILPGITRASIIELARDLGVKVSERKISVEEVFLEGAECFVSGTAAGITPLESLTHQGRTVTFGNGKPGELSMTLQKTLKGIQYGTIGDTKGWMYRV